MDKIRQFARKVGVSIDYTEDELCLRFAKMKLDHYQHKIAALQEEIEMLEEKEQMAPLTTWVPLFRGRCTECQGLFGVWELNLHNGRCVGCQSVAVSKGTSKCPFRK